MRIAENEWMRIKWRDLAWILPNVSLLLLLLYLRKSGL